MTVVVFLHGRGLGPSSAEAVAPAFPGAELVAPTGGIVSRRGYTWFDNIRTGVAQPDSVAAAEQGLLAWLDETLRGVENVWLTGFSNGGALCGHLLLNHPERFCGAALFAAPLVLPPWPARALRGKPVFYAHGDASDTIVDQQFYQAASDYLAMHSEARLEVHSYPVRHEITAEMVRDCGTWFERVRRDMGELS